MNNVSISHDRASNPNNFVDVPTHLSLVDWWPIAAPGFARMEWNLDYKALRMQKTKRDVCVDRSLFNENLEGLHVSVTV